MRFSEPQAIFLYEGFKYYPLWKVHFQLSCTFLFFFIQSVNCSKNFFSHFVSLYELSLWIIKISRGCPEAKVLIYIWDLAVLLFWGFICTVCTISDFFLVCKLHKSVNYTSHFGSLKVHRRCLYWNVFSTDINRKFIFNCFLLFKLFLQVGKFHSFFLTCSENEARCYIWGLLALSFIDSSIPIFQYFYNFISSGLWIAHRSLFYSLFVSH